METLFTTLRLETAYAINNLQYHLRKWPLIKKLFPPSYELQEWKLCFAILGFLRQFFMAFFYSFLYYGFMFFMCVVRNSDEDLVIASNTGSLFLCLLFFGTLIGGLLNSRIFEGDYNDYFAIVQLRINARGYVLSKYIFNLAKQLLMSLLAMLIICLISGLSFWFMLIVPIFLAGIKFIAVTVRIKLYQKKNLVSTSSIGDNQSLIFVILLLAAGITILVLNPTIPTQIIALVMLAIGLAGALCAFFVFRYDGYYIYFRRYYTALNEIKIKTTNNVVDAQTNKLDLKSYNKTSNKSGFAYMNELFLIRHHKVLMDTTRIITLIALAIFVVITAVMFFTDIAENISGNVIRIAPFLPFIFYMINRGSEYSAALFVNCDRSMLNYSFYRKRRNILTLFRLRLLGISKQNLLPAVVCGLGFVALEIVSALILGKPENIVPLNLMVLLIAPIGVSICFSVHYLMLYYVLQPFDHEAKSKNPVYNIALGLTYFICYELYQIIGKIESINPLVFAGCLVGFCIVYSLISGILVFTFAPKTFRNRR